MKMIHMICNLNEMNENFFSLFWEQWPEFGEMCQMEWEKLKKKKLSYKEKISKG